MSDFISEAVEGVDELFQHIRYDLDHVVKNPDSPFRKFLESAVEAEVYLPGMGLDEVAFREGYRHLARQILQIISV